MESEAWAHFLEEGSLSRVLAKSWAKILHEDRPEEGGGRALGCRDAGTVMKSQREEAGREREREVSRGQTIGWPGCHCQKHGLQPMGNREPLKYF